MSRGTHSSEGRCLAVWLLVTAAALGAWATVAGSAGSLASSATWHDSFEGLLVAVASAALVACAGWLWLVTTTTVVGLVRGREPSTVPRGVARRLVLVACGAAVVAGAGSPALAGAGSGDHSLVGLPLPDRAVADPVVSAAPPAPSAPAPEPAAAARPRTSITVRAGDSLWSIAAAGLGPDAEVGEIDAAWRELYAANRDAIGSDPDLIRPGLDLEPGPNRKARP
jgi:hypothetical protein